MVPASPHPNLVSHGRVSCRRSAPLLSAHDYSAIYRRPEPAAMGRRSYRSRGVRLRLDQGLGTDGRRAEPSAAAMKCKKHPCELGEGVCASCLRERLLALAREQSGGDRRRAGFSSSSSPQPAPVAFPRSVSPRASRRRDFRFFSTPQVGPTFGGEEEGGRIRRSGRFSILRTLFGDRRSKKPERDWVVREGSGSGSWFSALVRRRKKQPQISLAEGEAPLGHGRRAGQVVERGMSPAAENNRTDASGYSSESSNGRRRTNSTPMRRTVTSSSRNHHQLHQTELGTVSGFAVFLSPLQRVGTTARRTQVVGLAGFSVEPHSPAKSIHRHRHAAAGLGSCPSRNFASSGRII